MSIHYTFDDPMDVAGLLRGIAHDTKNDESSDFTYGPQPFVKLEEVVVGALREAADKIEKAVNESSEKAAQTFHQDNSGPEPVLRPDPPEGTSDKSPFDQGAPLHDKDGV